MLAKAAAAKRLVVVQLYQVCGQLHLSARPASTWIFPAFISTDACAA
jgi:hypothetical protein